MPQEFGLGALEGVGHFQTFFFGSVIFRLYLVVWDGGLEVEIRGFREILSSFCVGSAFCYGSLGFCVCQERQTPLRRRCGRHGADQQSVPGPLGPLTSGLAIAGFGWIGMDFCGFCEANSVFGGCCDCSSQIHRFNFFNDG